jgi:hypothetical protein
MSYASYRGMIEERCGGREEMMLFDERFEYGAVCGRLGGWMD